MKPKEQTQGQQLLYHFLQNQNADRDVYHDLMPFKVKEILLIATLYDAFSIEREGRFVDEIFGEFHQLNLITLPRIIGVSTEDEVHEQLGKKQFDLVIIIASVDKAKPKLFSRLIKQSNPMTPIYLLLNNNKYIRYYSENLPSHLIDKTFVWNGDSSIFLAMVKHLEDNVNVENDTATGIIKVVLLVEDSEKYYSRYLPILYHVILEQTRRVITEVKSDELYKVLRLRARPRVILTSNYEDAVQIAQKYERHLLALITDVKFLRQGKLDNKAGFELTRLLRSKNENLPVIIQSSDVDNRLLAEQLKTTFIDKNSQNLLQEIKFFLRNYLGFGKFIFRTNAENEIGIATNLDEFLTLIESVPVESLRYHGERNHFSLWLMAQGEIKIAKVIQPILVTDFSSEIEFRDYLLYALNKYRNESKKGRLVQFSETDLLDERNVVSLTSGNLGGKGRGLVFINTLLYNINFRKLVKGIKIRMPITAIIGTDEFDLFLENNHFSERIYQKDSSKVDVKSLFLTGSLSDFLIERLRIFLQNITKPVAVRSSSLFEDSLMQPFAGVFETFLLPNNDDDFEIRLKQLCDAIKLVYASIFSKLSRNYIEAVNYKIDEEKMAVVLQEVVGNEYDGYFYPQISGVAQSYNFYPVSHMKPEEGFAVVALGLGQYVVDGEKAFRFSPVYPKTDMVTPKTILKDTQTEFFAVDMTKKAINLLEGETAGLAKLSIEVAEQHGTIKHLASVYNPDNDTITPGLSVRGPRVINFANILKYNYVPLAESISVMLDVVKEAMGSPVEIEFAVDLNKDKFGEASFYLLQIKPLLNNPDDYVIDETMIKKKDLLLFAEKSLGNGKIETIRDIIFVDINRFDKISTEEIAGEITQLNEQLKKENREYLLIGPGRWGSSDKFIGIPVKWSQISKAKVIVETSLKDFPLDASLGSHFFHNVISMNVGYFSVQPEISKSFINWEKLFGQQPFQTTKHCIHLRFKKPITVQMDGKRRIAIIY